MTNIKATERVRVVDILQRYGKCLELVSLDPNFHDISVGLYEKDGVMTVWTFSRTPGVEERIRQIRDQLVALGGLVLPNVETYEQLYPVHFKRQEFRTDAAGPGAYRGGTGCHFEVQINVDAEYAFRGEGLYTPSCFGAAGGRAGDVGEMVLTFADGGTEQAPKYAVRHYGPLTLRSASPGGGGWGEPRRREPGRVVRDVRDGVVSRRAAEEIYGVAVSADGKSINEAATAALRAE